ncbi:MAG: hypothetical protein P8N02_16570 [Actinomycetota bacterium]|nr:hypothetical protein [Actinomycetota bacterium]
MGGLGGSHRVDGAGQGVGGDADGVDALLHQEGGEVGVVRWGPVLHAAALDRPGNVKGGTYSHGAFPGSGQYGVLQITDDGGSEVVAELSGWNWAGNEIVRLRVEVDAPSGQPMPVADDMRCGCDTVRAGGVEPTVSQQCRGDRTHVR